MPKKLSVFNFAWGFTEILVEIKILIIKLLIFIKERQIVEDQMILKLFANV
jgi:hypothetical protein